jgi:flagellar basal-body rod protein FlgG
MEAQQTNIDVIANNISNMNTAGYKKRRGLFEDLLYQNVKPAGTASSNNTQYPIGMQLGLGTRAVATEVIFLQGDYSHTGNPLDIVIEGAGFFPIKLPTGEVAYTRAGSFHRDREGNMVTMDGDPLEPKISIPPDALSITIGPDGTISVTQPNQKSAQQVGKIEIAAFQNPAGLNAIGRNLFLPTDASGDPVKGKPGEEGRGSLMQAYLEQSNVNIVEEMVSMIVSQRAYESTAKVLKAADEMFTQINNVAR